MFAVNVVYVILGIPRITAFIGYVTNGVAVKMIFHPEEFVGVRKIGWQGVVPAKADTFAVDVADNAEGKVLSAAEMVAPGTWGQMDPSAQVMVLEQIKSEVRALAPTSNDSFGSSRRSAATN